MYTFVVREEPFFTMYVKRNWSYFTSNDVEGVKITIRKDTVWLHIDRRYCVLCNDLITLLTQKYYCVECNKKALAWIAEYDSCKGKYFKNNNIK